MTNIDTRQGPAGTWRRISITIAALLVVELLANVPLPGINAALLATPADRSGGMLQMLAGNSAWRRVSLGALDMIPLLSAFFFFEGVGGATTPVRSAMPRASRESFDPADSW